MLTFAVLGRVGYDLFAEQQHRPLHAVRQFRAAMGGSSANIAVGLARLGATVHMLAALPDDPLGRFLYDELEREGINTSALQAVSGHNVSLCLSEVSPPAGFRQVFYRNDPADACIEWSDAIQQAITVSACLLTNGTSLCADPSRATTHRALEAARQAGRLTVLDVDYRASSWPTPQAAGEAVRAVWHSLDILFANAGEMLLLAPNARPGDEERIAREALAAGLRLVVWKQGELGATAFSSAGRVHVPAFTVPVTSTIGAGDGFAAGFLFAYSQHLPVDLCLEYGNACAAQVVMQVGCGEAMPTAAELEAFVQSGRQQQPHTWQRRA